MLVNNDFQTWHLIGWQHSHQPIKSLVEKPCLINMEFNMDVYIVTPSPDKLGDTVRISDLLAVCARYHRKCGKGFHAIPAPKSNSFINGGLECVETKPNADALGVLANDMVSIWSSLDVEFLCNSNSGHVRSKRTLLKKGIEPLMMKYLLLNSKVLQMYSLQWRHTERDDVSNHQHLDCVQPFVQHRPKKTSELRVVGLCEGNSLVTGGFPAQRASNAENVSIWWRHHVVFRKHAPQHLKLENYYMDGVALCLRKIVKYIETDSKGYQTLKGHFHIIQEAHRQAFNFTLCEWNIAESSSCN